MSWAVAVAIVAIVAIVATWAGYRVTHRSRSAANKLIDPVTICSRDGFDRVINERRALADSTATIVVALADYEALVAEHGEQVGIDLGSATTRALAASIRDDDISDRFADDEFAVLLTGAGAHGAELVAHRIRQNIELAKHHFGAVIATLDSSAGQIRVNVAARVDSPSS